MEYNTTLSFKYEIYTDSNLAFSLKNSIIAKNHLSFIVRLHHHQPLIQLKAADLIDMIDDLNFETGMGWESISVDGKYIMEFTDGYQNLAKSNFEIFPGTKCIN